MLSVVKIRPAARQCVVGLAGAVSLLILAGSPAAASISGFGGGTGWTANSGPTFSGDSLTLTTAATNQGRSAYFNTKQDITSFTASFSYQHDPTTSSNNPADGITFVVQNAGLNALGGTGGSKGYAGTFPTSVAIILDVNGNDGTSAGTNGSLTSLLPRADLPVTTLLTQADITVTYDGTTLKYTVTNPANTAQTSTRSVAVNIPSVVGASTAYVGFTGGTGGRFTTQTVSNFSFVPEPGSMGLTLAVAATGLLRRSRRRTPSGAAVTPAA